MSTIIAADKQANKIFVYDLNGTVLQELDVPKPGNIDIRQGVALGHTHKHLDLITVNQRSQGENLRVWRVQPKDQVLKEISTRLPIDDNYGGCLFRSSDTNRLYYLSTSKSKGVRQYELFFD